MNRAPLNVLNGVADPLGRRWRVVALDGVGPRLNDFEVRKVLGNGATLCVARTGEARIEMGGATPPAAGAAFEQTVSVTVEADDGPILHAATDGTPLWRGQGTRLTVGFPVRIAGYAPTWSPASETRGWALVSSEAADFTLRAVAPGSGLEKQTIATDRGYVDQVADAAGGAVVATGTGVTNGGTVPPDTIYYLPQRRVGVLRFQNVVQEGVQMDPDTYPVRQWLALSADVSAQTVLLVVRRVSTGGDSPIVAGPDGSTHFLRYGVSNQITVGSATAEYWRSGRKIAGPAADLGAGSFPVEDVEIVAVRFGEALNWRYVNAKNSAGLDARSQDIFEMHLVAGAMSDAEIDQWMGYAAHRYDLAHVLPHDHVYRFGPPGFETPTVEPAPLPSVIRFGRLTAVGAGGWPLPYLTSRTLGGPDAALFAVSEGRLVPAAALGAGPYAITVGGVAVTVEIDADVYHVRSQAEMQAAEVASRTLGRDATIRWREGRYGYVVYIGARVPAGRTLTIDCDHPRRTVFDKFGIKGDSTSLSPGAAVLSGLRAHDRETRDGIMALTNVGAATVRDCEAHGDWLDPAKDYYTYYHGRGGGFAVNASESAVLELSECHNVNVCGAVSSYNGESFNRYNRIYARFADGPTANAGGTSSGRRWVHDNLYWDAYGRVEYYTKPHNDVMQTRLVNSVTDPTNYVNQVPSFITVQRNIVWQNVDNITFEGTERRGERGFYIEGSGGGYGQHSGVVSANIMFGRHETGIDCNPGNSEGVVAIDNSLVAPDGDLMMGGARTQDRNVMNRLKGDSFIDEINATPVDGQVKLTSHPGLTWPDQAADVFMAPVKRAGMGPHDIIAALTPRPGGPCDLGGGKTAGAITLDGQLKPLVTVFPPGRPAPPTLALDGSTITVTLPADPTDLHGLPVIRRDVRLAPTNDITNGSEPSWATYLDKASGATFTANSPGDPNYARWRAVTAAGPGLWSLPSSPVTPPAVSIGWTPADATRVLHYDASDAGSVTKTGSTVTAVANLVGGGPGLAVTGTPQHGARTLNSLDVFDCDYAAAFLATGVTIPSEHIVATVFAIDSASSSLQSVFHVGDESVARYELYSGGATTFFGKTRLTGLRSESDPAGGLFASGFWNGAPFVILVGVFSRAAGKISWFVDGSLTATQKFDDLTLGVDLEASEPGPVPANAVGLWRDGSPGTNQPDGAWAEFLMLDGTMTADRRRLEGWLAHKWGLTARLPSAHPYKSLAP